MTGKYRIVDGHAHTFSSAEVAEKIIQSFNRIYNIEFVNSGNGTIPDILDNMTKSGVDYTVTANFAPAKILHRNNLWGLEVAKQYRQLIPLVSFHPDMDGRLADYLEQYIGMGAAGIKIHPMAQGFEPDHPGLRDVYRLCAEISFPVVYHCGRVSNTRLNKYSDMHMIRPVVEKYPDIPFILTHMADGNDKDVVSLAECCGNVYFDTSIVITGYPAIMKVNEPSWLDDSVVVDVVNAIGADRVLFGSDYPWGSPVHDVKRLVKMMLSDEQKDLILSGNAFKLFKNCGNISNCSNISQ